MRKTCISKTTLVLVTVLFLSFSKAPAKEGDKKTEKNNEGYVSTEVCQGCHPKVYDRFKTTPMGTLFLRHPRTAIEKHGCETCHGPAKQHVSSGGKSIAGLVRFAKEGEPKPLLTHNDVCLKCHQKRQRLFWSGGVHSVQRLSCISCHAVHTGRGITSRHQLARLTVADTCLTCHKEQVRAENKFSHHPLREGKINCASCHNPHGTVSPKLIRGISVKELCFNCHAQYRGPFIFQHPPVMEDCFNCHQPHGSSYPALLKQPPIRLCRDCHITFHNLNFTVGGRTHTRINMMAGTGCVNCHRNIHGSNTIDGNLFFR